MAIATMVVGCAVAAFSATFDSIPFDTPTFSDGDPLGVAAITNATKVAQDAQAGASEAYVAATNADHKAEMADEAAQSAASAAQEAANAAQEAKNTADAATNDLAKVKIDLPTAIDERLTNDVVVIGQTNGTTFDATTKVNTNSIVLAVNKGVEDMDAEDGEVLVTADKIRLDAPAESLYIGGYTLQYILNQSGGGGGDVNVIETIKVNGTALVPDANKAVNITVPAPGDANVIEVIKTNGVALAIVDKAVDITIPTVEVPSIDGKLDSTNGVAFGDLKVYPMPSGVVGQTHTIITHESISIGDAEYKNDRMTYNGETYEFSSDTNGLARLKDIPTVSTNGVEIVPDANKNINIVIPSAGEGNVIEVVKTNGVALAVSNKEVDIAIPDISGLATKQEVSNLTITTGKVTDLDAYKNPTISAAALSAIDGINNAPDIATIKSTLTNFLQQFVIQAP